MGDEKDPFNYESAEESESSIYDAPVKDKCKSLRFPRQKYISRWENIFSWLKADESDETVGICTICSKRLVCKKSHLERHENSFKHRRLSKKNLKNIEFATIELQDPSTLDIIEFPKSEVEYDCNYVDNVEELSEYNIEYDVLDESAINLQENAIESDDEYNTAELNRVELMKTIERDRCTVHTFINNVTQQPLVIPPPQKDSIDLFFESVAASVKLLPPKMVSAVKHKVLHVITDFELEALSEKEMKTNRMTTPVETSEQVPIQLESMASTSQIVYSYH
ncbi:protein suppressor of variegation 3-7-like isoform X2 [Teleopsis dalmanni]|uniref:protein suppressor of variegation 3-7-like isoform X2 n=1 Tax=Teleopsis dalmanni TaxID=139649 RepID=UPI0018CDB796|nr:protein suppressor of variegation 3-7-like isoform X2 [Teleopsis dalmanni]